VPQQLDLSTLNPFGRESALKDMPVVQTIRRGKECLRTMTQNGI
jgi:hypothetical protein